MKISLAWTLDRTAVLTGVSVSAIKRIASDASAAATNDPLATADLLEVHDFNQGIIRRTINTMYTMQKVLPTRWTHVPPGVGWHPFVKRQSRVVSDAHLICVRRCVGFGFWLGSAASQTDV